MNDKENCPMIPLEVFLENMKNEEESVVRRLAIKEVIRLTDELISTRAKLYDANRELEQAKEFIKQLGAKL